MNKQSPKWWEEGNPSFDWEGLYEAFPNVDFNEVYSSVPKELLTATPEELNVRQADVRRN